MLFSTRLPKSEKTPIRMKAIKLIREPGNFYTHLIPAVIAIPGLFLLLQKSNGYFEDTAAYIYGLAIITLFSVSAIYHSVPKTELGIRFWQKFDHCCIYLMIAGSFTPTSLIIFFGWQKWLLFSLVWAVALIGCILKISNRLQKGNLSTFIYIGMGCMIIPFIKRMIEVLPAMALVWLFLGGLFYVGGTVYYTKDKPYRYMHSHTLWHLFVNAGAFCHFIYNYQYVFHTR